MKYVGMTYETDIITHEVRDIKVYECECGVRMKGNKPCWRCEGKKEHHREEAQVGLL